MMFWFIIPLAIVLVIVGWKLLGGKIKKNISTPDGPHIGPIIGNKNYSNCEFKVTSTGCKATLKPGDELDAILYPCKTIPKEIIVTYKVNGEFTAIESETPNITFYFQRQGDNWSADGVYQWYRWYSKEMFPLISGEKNTVRIPLDVKYWKGVNTAPKPHQEYLFHEAVSDPVMVGFGFGGRGGRMHGITGNGSIELFDVNINYK